MKLNQALFVYPILIGLLGVLVLQHLLADNYQALGVVKYTVNSMIFAVSLLLPKHTRDHAILGYAFKFIFAADFFFVFLGTLPGFSPENKYLQLSGLTVFTLGYFCFIYLSLRGAKWSLSEIAMSLPVLGIVFPTGAFCFHFMKPEQTLFFFLFLPFVSFVGWCGLSVVKRNHWLPHISKLFALAGFLFFLSEMGYAVGTFFPGLTRNTPWIGNEIWVTYIPGWIVMLYALSHEKWRVER